MHYVIGTTMTNTASNIYYARSKQNPTTDKRRSMDILSWKTKSSNELPSRGRTGSALAENKGWFSGPEFLTFAEACVGPKLLILPGKTRKLNL